MNITTNRAKKVYSICTLNVAMVQGEHCVYIELYIYIEMKKLKGES